MVHLKNYIIFQQNIPEAKESIPLSHLQFGYFYNGNSYARQCKLVFIWKQGPNPLRGKAHEQYIHTGDQWLAWRHHELETISILLALCEGNLPVTGGFPSQRVIMWSFDVLFDVSLNKLLNKQSSCRWSEMLWCSCDVTNNTERVLMGCSQHE